MIGGTIVSPESESVSAGAVTLTGVRLRAAVVTICGVGGVHPRIYLAGSKQMEGNPL